MKAIEIDILPHYQLDSQVVRQVEGLIRDYDNKVITLKVMNKTMEQEYWVKRVKMTVVTTSDSNYKGD